MNRKLSSQRRLLRSLTIASLFLSASLPCVHAQDDTTAPVLVGFGISPQQVDTSSGPADITVSAHITDNLSGQRGGAALFHSSSGNQHATAFFSLQSGTPLDGMYSATLQLPVFSESGTWEVDYVLLNDAATNVSYYYPAQLNALGFPSTFTNLKSSVYEAFVQPPINSDGSSIFSAKRGVVPVKFTVTRDELPVCTVADATISVLRTAGSSAGAIDEATYLSASDSGSYFRVDPASCQYIYNLSVSSFGPGSYRVNISIDGVVVGSAVFALK
jgi:hypothetical protein